MTHHRPTPRRCLSATAVALALAAALAACGSGSSKTSSNPTTTTPAKSSNSASGGSGPNATAGGTPPGAFGTVAAITGSTMEVQNQQSGQETVSWTSTTRFSKTATLTSASVKAGDCVTVTGTTSGGVITARSVVVSAASSTGSCTSGFGGGGFVRGGGTFRGGGTGGTGSSTPPSSRPANRTGTGAANLANLGVASGSVVSVAPTSMVIHGVSFSGAGFARRSAGSTAPSTPPTTAAPTNITVTLASSTTFTETVTATAASLAVGDCVMATGSTNSTGAVAASVVRITATAGQTCTAGFGGGGGRFFGGGGANGAPANG
jgi:Domain of unknown function (DUF5666)